MELSQNRARNVLGFLRQQDCFINLETIKKDRLQYWLTANGLSYGRTVDKDFKIAYGGNLPIDNDKSRRVEFRIVTTSEAIINEASDDLRTMFADDSYVLKTIEEMEKHVQPIYNHIVNNNRSLLKIIVVHNY
jgi:hypothetical protein